MNSFVFIASLPLRERAGLLKKVINYLHKQDDATAAVNNNRCVMQLS